MIKCALEQLPQAQCDNIRTWLARPEAKLLCDIVSAHGKKYLTDALNDALSASDGNIKIEAANANLRQAQRYSHFLEVFDEILSRRDPFETAKLL